MADDHRAKPPSFMEDVDTIKARIEELKKEREESLTIPAKDD